MRIRPPRRAQVVGGARRHEGMLLAPLRQRLEGWSAGSTVGDIFSPALIDVMKMYTFYANNYYTALSTISNLK